MEIDDIIRSVGDFGRGHMFIFVCICLITQFTASWHIFAITLIGASPSHHCTVHTAFEIDEYIPVDVDNEGEAIYSSCTQYAQPGGPSNATSACQNGWTYSETPYGTTIVTEWDLVCDRGHLSAFSQSVMMFGVIVGAFIFGYISDRVGRKRVLTVALLCQGCLGVLEAFSPTYIFFIIVRFFMGIFDQGYQLPGYTMTSEMFTPKRRPYAFTMLLNFWAAGILTFPVLAFFIQDWRTLQIVISVPFFLFHLIAWFLPESPRWLISVGRYKEATNVFAKIARLNGRKIDPMTMKPQQFVDNGIDNKAFDNCDENVTNVGSGRTINTISQDTNDEEKAQENPKSIAGNNTFTYLFRTRRMNQVTIVMMVLWFVSALAYYGVSLNSVELAGDPYLNLFLCGAVEIPSHWLSAFLSIWFGRRRPICVLLFLGGIACVTTGFIPERSANGLDLTPFIVTTAMAAKFFVSSAYALVSMCATEVFPTVVRSKGIGIVSVSGRIGALIAPLVLLLGEVHSNLPIIFFGCIGIVPSFLVFLLPEMRGRKQPQTAEDLDFMYEEDKLKKKMERKPDIRNKSPMVDRSVTPDV